MYIRCPVLGLDRVRLLLRVRRKALIIRRRILRLRLNGRRLLSERIRRNSRRRRRRRHDRLIRRGKRQLLFIPPRRTRRGRRHLIGTSDPRHRLPQQVRVDRLAAHLMFLPVRVEVILPLEPTAAEVAFELVFGGVGTTVSGEGGAIVEGLAAEGSFADEGPFVVMSAHVALITVAGQQDLPADFAREGNSNFLLRLGIVMDAGLVPPQIWRSGVCDAAIFAVEVLGLLVRWECG